MAPLHTRPLLARKLVAVWRLQHLYRGDDLTVGIYPGEWPDGIAKEVRGLEVHEDARIGGPGAMLALGLVPGGKWRGTMIYAHAIIAPMSVEHLALTAIHMDEPSRDGSELRVWMSQTPGESGPPPSFTVAKQ